MRTGTSAPPGRLSGDPAGPQATTAHGRRSRAADPPPGRRLRRLDPPACSPTTSSASARPPVAALGLGQPGRLSGQTQVAALEAAVRDERLGGLHRDVGRNHDAQSANGRGAVVIPRRRPCVSRNAPPENPSCIGAVVLITCSIDPRRPVGSGPPMTATMPALAVTALLHDRATARAMWPTLAETSDAGNASMPRPATLEHREARRRIPPDEFRVEGRPVATADMEAIAAAERTSRRQHDIARMHDPAGGPAGCPAPGRRTARQRPRHPPIRSTNQSGQCPWRQSSRADDVRRPPAAHHPVG